MAPSSANRWRSSNIFGDGAQAFVGIAQRKIHVAGMKRAVLLLDGVFLRLAACGLRLSLI